MKDVAAKNLATEEVAVEVAIESDKAEEVPHHNVHVEKSDAKTQFKRSEANKFWHSTIKELVSLQLL